MASERLLLLLTLAVVLAVAVVGARWWARRTTARVTEGPADPLWDALGERPDGRTAVVAFSTPSCAACHTAQRPALQQLQQTLGKEVIRVLHVDVATRPEVAQRFGVLTVPSTVVLHPTHGVLAVNNGFTPSQRLAAQAQAA